MRLLLDSWLQKTAFLKYSNFNYLSKTYPPNSQVNPLTHSNIPYPLFIFGRVNLCRVAGGGGSGVGGGGGVGGGSG